MQIVLDTTVLIDVLRGQRGRPQWLIQLLRNGHSLSTSALNVAEIFAGLRGQEETRPKAFLQELTCYEILATIAEIGARILNEWAERAHTDFDGYTDRCCRLRAQPRAGH